MGCPGNHCNNHNRTNSTGGNMKSMVNRVTRMGYGNEGIARKLGVSSSLIHKHRKSFNPMVDRAINTHFFTKSIPDLAKSYRAASKSTVAVKDSFWSKFKRFMRFVFAPVYRLQAMVRYR